MLLVLLLGTTLMFRIAFSSAQTTGTATVAPSDGLNLRDSASTDGQILTTIPGGDTVTVTGAPTGDGWYPVTYQGMSGWVDGAYLTFAPASSPASASSPPVASPVLMRVSPPPPSATPPPVVGGSPPAAAAPGQTTVIVNAERLNVRVGPIMTASVLTTVPRGTAVQVTGPATANWLPVTVNGISGWVDSDFVTPSGGQPSPATPPAPSGVVVPVSLTLTSTTGQPLAGHSFSLAGQQGQPSQTQVTDQNGRAVFTGVTPGIYSLSEMGNLGYSFSSMTINGASAAQAQLFELEAGGTYDINVVDQQTGTPGAVPTAPSSTASPPSAPPSAAPPAPAATPTVVTPALPPEQVPGPGPTPSPDQYSDGGHTSSVDAAVYALSGFVLHQPY